MQWKFSKNGKYLYSIFIRQRLFRFHLVNIEYRKHILKSAKFVGRGCDVVAMQLFKACIAAAQPAPSSVPGCYSVKTAALCPVRRRCAESRVQASDIKCKQHAVCSTGCPNLTFSAEQMCYLWHLVAVLYWILCTYLYSQSEYFILKSLFVINHPLKDFSFQ